MHAKCNWSAQLQPPINARLIHMLLQLTFRAPNDTTHLSIVYLLNSMEGKSIRPHEGNTKRLLSVERGFKASEKEMLKKPIDLSMSHLRVKYTSPITFTKIGRDDGDDDDEEEEELVSTNVPTSPAFNSMGMEAVHTHGCAISYGGFGPRKSKTSSCLHKAPVTWNDESLDCCIECEGIHSDATDSLASSQTIASWIRKAFSIHPTSTSSLASNEDFKDQDQDQGALIVT